MSLAYFCLSALAILPSSAVASIDPTLPAVDVMLKPEQRAGFTQWVYEQQSSSGGFRGSDSVGTAQRYMHRLEHSVSRGLRSMPTVEGRVKVYFRASETRVDA